LSHAASIKVKAAAMALSRHEDKKLSKNKAEDVLNSWASSRKQQLTTHEELRTAAGSSSTWTLLHRQ
jgi:hypothetical protein